MTPGPTPVPPQVLAAMALPIVHHRSPDFRPTYRQVLDRLKEVYKTQGEVLLYTASGTAGLESVVANLTSPGDRVVAVSAGYFGERWADIPRSVGGGAQPTPSQDAPQRWAARAWFSSRSPRRRPGSYATCVPMLGPRRTPARSLQWT